MTDMVIPAGGSLRICCAFRPVQTRRYVAFLEASGGVFQLTGKPGQGKTPDRFWDIQQAGQAALLKSPVGQTTKCWITVQNLGDVPTELLLVQQGDVFEVTDAVDAELPEPSPVRHNAPSKESANLVRAMLKHVERVSGRLATQLDDMLRGDGDAVDGLGKEAAHRARTVRDALKQLAGLFPPRKKK